MSWLYEHIPTTAGLDHSISRLIDKMVDMSPASAVDPRSALAAASRDKYIDPEKQAQRHTSGRRSIKNMATLPPARDPAAKP